MALVYLRSNDNTYLRTTRNIFIGEAGWLLNGQHYGTWNGVPILNTPVSFNILEQINKWQTVLDIGRMDVEFQFVDILAINVRTRLPTLIRNFFDECPIVAQLSFTAYAYNMHTLAHCTQLYINTNL